MSSLAKHTSILIICRFLNYVILFVTPVFLVRMLSVAEYGKYREFILYSGIIANLASFSVNRSLLYFLGKYKNNSTFVENSILINFIISIIVVLALVVFKGLIEYNSTYDFVYPLCVYLFFLLNFDFCESYWIATQKTNYVLYYIAARSSLRSVALIGAAFCLKNIMYMIYALVLVEFLKFIFVAIYSYRKKLIKFKFNFGNIKEQIVYTFPMGVSNFIFYTNKEISKFFIIYTLGVEYLALYAVGSYQIPVINIVRSSIADIVFPEICSRMNSSKHNGLDLWKKTNVLYCAIVFPFFVVFYYFSEDFIRIFFTDKYIDSVPVFRIYMFLMVKECFETGIPLRSIGKNKFYVFANFFALIINIFLIFMLKDYMRFYGPAIAYIVSDTFIYLFFGLKILSVYQIKLYEIFYWKKIFKLSIVNIMVFPVLLVGEFVEINYIAKPIIFSSLFFIIYFAVISRSNIEEVCLVFNKLYSKIKFYS
ncbi:oligosaccharide flippase family protein [Desulfoplanes formicivorans]|uniref:Polysaccharide biosynthesis protein C-terminal domain-containing protein n=1 Tax=Desulfoplanes formicivorans TaxID=1592317 RepID=A0A194ADT6_9BACT|nr:oligosaccharide flippase family protein [Desulfoplanes formicivorans]GAU07365.1 hypothetical protein DPF_0043 [Desulfoplanes formicivorans]